MPLVGAQDFTTGQAARLVIGQPNYTEQDPISTQDTMGSPGGVAYANNTLFVVDSNRLGATPNNNRILIYRNVSSFIPGIYDVPPQGTRCPACVGVPDVVLGQKDFVTAEGVRTPTQDNVRNPVAVASTGTMVAVADTDNNRILVWRSIPTTNMAPADIVLGQKDFTSSKPDLTASAMRGPQGVWFDPQGGLWVADTGNNRVLYFGVPSQNGQEAKLVLGQPNFTTNPIGISATLPVSTRFNMLSPVSVTTDGTRLFVADLGFSRVLIWNSIPNSNGQQADVVIGQKDFTIGTSNSSSDLCDSNGTDTDGNATYPPRCSRTLSFPRFALSDGKRLFVADGGNDRILMYFPIPRLDGASADVVLGQPSMELNQASDSANPLGVSASDAFRTPTSLAFDGTNLYAADVFNRRVLVYTPGDYALPLTAVRNAASLEVFAVGAVSVGGIAKEKDELTITIEDRDYIYIVAPNDTLSDVTRNLVNLINANGGDPSVVALQNGLIVRLTAKQGGELGNSVTLAVKTSQGATTTLTASGATLTGGQNAAQIAPFTIVTILGDNLADTTDSRDLTTTLPTDLGGVEVLVDGTKVPIQAVSPTQINAQIPIDVADGNSSAAVVRTTRKDGSVTVSTALGVPIIGQNPGIYAQPGTEPRAGIVLHYSSHATGTISVDGTAQAGDQATVIIEGREYTYFVQEADTLVNVMNGLINLINDSDPRVEAFTSGVFTRIRLRARVEGPEGNGIAISTRVSDGSAVILTATNTELCCANQAGAPVTPDNPALPGETIVVLATGLGAVKPEAARAAMTNGVPYAGPEFNEPIEFVSSLAGGKTANVLFAGLRLGAVGTYEVHLELNSDLPTDPLTQVTIAQSFQVSNIVTVPVVNPKDQIPIP